MVYGIEWLAFLVYGGQPGSMYGNCMIIIFPYNRLMKLCDKHFLYGIAWQAFFVYGGQLWLVCNMSSRVSIDLNLL